MPRSANSQNRVVSVIGAIKSGPGAVTGFVFQWQDSKQVVVWPEKIAEGRLKFPNFVKLSQ